MQRHIIYTKQDFEPRKTNPSCALHPRRIRDKLILQLNDLYFLCHRAYIYGCHRQIKIVKHCSWDEEWV